MLIGLLFLKPRCSFGRCRFWFGGKQEGAAFLSVMKATNGELCVPDVLFDEFEGITDFFSNETVFCGFCLTLNFEPVEPIKDNKYIQVRIQKVYTSFKDLFWNSFFENVLPGI